MRIPQGGSAARAACVYPLARASFWGPSQPSFPSERQLVARPVGCGLVRGHRWRRLSVCPHVAPERGPVLGSGRVAMRGALRPPVEPHRTVVCNGPRRRRTADDAVVPLARPTCEQLARLLVGAVGGRKARPIAKAQVEVVPDLLAAVRSHAPD